MTPRAEQMVLDYLSQVGQATYGYLTPRRRAEYLVELRSRIDTECGDSADPDKVQRALDRFGTPEELVARECAQDADSDDDGEETTEKRKAVPRHADRELPPWRGGPDRGFLRGGRSTAVRDRNGDRPRGVMVGVMSAARNHPSELFTIAVYLVSGLVGQVVLVWVLGAVLVVLSDVWSRRDKAVAVGVPLAATLIGMALWPGEAPYIDQVILNSLMETGVIALRLAALGSAIYLLVRVSRLARGAGT